jgi:DNA invertase Pin-like site-specific DNA recombinase
MQQLTGNKLQGAEMSKLIAVNAQGLRIGEDHPNAKLTDGEVETIRQLNEDGMNYKTIAEKFECSKSTVQMICQHIRRAQTVARFKAVHVPKVGDDKVKP